MFVTLLTLAVTSPMMIPVQSGLRCTDQKYNVTQLQFKLNHKPIDLNRDVTTYELENKLSGKLFNKNAKDGQSRGRLSDGMSKYKDWLISGAGHGDVDTNIDVEFLAIPQDPKQTQFCVLYKKVNVTIDYQTKMTIAKELDKDSCEFAAIMDHEMKRHEAYTKVVDSVAAELEEALPVALDRMQHSLVYGQRLSGTYTKMSDNARDFVAGYREQMLSLMDEYNKVIDSEDALQKLAASCKHKIIDGEQPDIKPSDGAKDYFSKFRDKKK